MMSPVLPESFARIESVCSQMTRMTLSIIRRMEYTLIKIVRLLSLLFVDLLFVGERDITFLASKTDKLNKW